MKYPDSKVHGANMGTIWGQQGPMLAPWISLSGNDYFVYVNPAAMYKYLIFIICYVK